MSKFKELPLMVKITLLAILGMGVWLFIKSPQRTLENIKSATASIERKTDGLVNKIEESQEPILGEKIDPEKKIEEISQDLVEKITEYIPEDLPAQVKKEVEEKVRVEVEKRVEEITHEVVIERIKYLPDPVLESLKKEICQ